MDQNVSKQQKETTTKKKQQHSTNQLKMANVQKYTVQYWSWQWHSYCFLLEHSTGYHQIQIHKIYFQCRSRSYSLSCQKSNSQSCIASPPLLLIQERFHTLFVLFREKTRDKTFHLDVKEKWREWEKISILVKKEMALR